MVCCSGTIMKRPTSKLEFIDEVMSSDTISASPEEPQAIQGLPFFDFGNELSMNLNEDLEYDERI